MFFQSFIYDCFIASSRILYSIKDDFRRHLFTLTKKITHIIKSMIKLKILSRKKKDYLIYKFKYIDDDELIN